MKMKIKLLLNLMLAFFMLLMTVNASEYFYHISFDFDYETPSKLKISTYECTNSDCTNAVSNSQIKYYSGNAITCWDNYKSDRSAFLSCMNNYKLNSNILNLNQYDSLFIYYPDEGSNGYISNLYTEGDTYIPRWYRVNSLSCDFDTCVSPDPF
jgi:hypothetical protein